MPGKVDPAGGRTFTCRSVSTGLGLARRLSRLSVAALLAPVVGVFVVGGAAEQLELLALRDAAMELSILAFVAGTLASAVLAIAVTRVGRMPAPGGEIVVTGEQVSVRRDGREILRFTTARLTAGFARASGAGGCVELHLDDGRVVRAVMRSRSRAEVLLAALGAGPDGRRARIPLASPAPAVTAGCVTYPLALLVWFQVFLAIEARLGRLASAIPILLGLLVVASTLLARRAFRAPEVIIGADGVRLRGAWRERFLRFEEIERVRTDGSKLVLDLVPEADEDFGGPVTVPCADLELASAVADRVRDTRAATRGGARPPAVAELLDPGDRPLAAWREALAKLLRGEGRYRQGAVTEEDVLAVLEDPAAPARLRIGAAIALREGSAPEARERVRIAASACVDETIKAALEAAAEEEIDEAPIRKAVRRG